MSSNAGQAPDGADNSTACFFPNQISNGGTSIRHMVPCDPAAPHSACCGLEESCVGSGLCYSDQGYVYRGACTDRTWSASQCSAACRDATPGGRNSGDQSGHNNLARCGFANGVPVWTCSSDISACSNESLTFPLNIGGVRQAKITGLLETPSNSTGSNSTSCAATSSSPTACPPHKSNVAIGAGIGVPLGVLFLITLIWGIWERRGRMALKKGGDYQGVRGGHIAEATPVSQYPHGNANYSSGVSQPGQNTYERHELPVTPIRGDVTA